jgi:hypothetical protein
VLSFFCYVSVLVFYVLGLDSYGVAGEFVFGLGVAYHLRYFYVMCCECGDSDGYRR